MKNYYIIKAYQYYRFFKYNRDPFVNRIHGVKNNHTGILDYKEKYCATTFVNEIYDSDSYYGLSHILKEFSGYKYLIASEIEHGVYFGRGNSDSIKVMPTVITFGNERKKILRSKTTRPVLTIGPYIQYLQHNYPIEQLKRELGKTILVFPIHTLETISVDYEINEFINFIDTVKEAENVQTVLVSLYFNDISKWAPRYEKAGYRVVCSGYRTDIDFLQRQKAFYEVSDLVVTNGVGTHIGYAVYCGKPVSLFEQQYQYSFQNPERIKDAMPFAEEEIASSNVEKVKECFRGVNTTLSARQYEIVRDFWGLSIRRKPEEIKAFLEMSKSILNRSRFSGKGYNELAKDYIDRTDSLYIALLKECIE